MLSSIKNGMNFFLRKFDAIIVRRSTYEKAAPFSEIPEDIKILLSLPKDHLSDLLKNLIKSKSQLRQDLFVLSQLVFKKDGYFVEFGATNGITFSNTYLLEKEFGWKGVLAEPARNWHKELVKNRSCSVDKRCVWKESGSMINFREVGIGELSTIDNFSNSDVHAKARLSSKKYSVETVSLNDLLKYHNAPSVIDYLSIDTEGSEYEILAALDFSKFSFRVITCEHNYTETKEKVHNLLSAHGYRRVLEEVSKFDDWYVHSSLIVD